MTARAMTRAIPTLTETILAVLLLHDRLVREYYWDDVTADEQRQLEHAAASLRDAIRMLLALKAGRHEDPL